MKKVLLMTISLLFVFACEDPAPKKTITEEDMQVIDAAKPMPDLAVKDAMIQEDQQVVDMTAVVDLSMLDRSVEDQMLVVDMNQNIADMSTISVDMEVMDMATIADMEVMDMLPPPLPTNECTLDTECAVNHKCIAGSCRFELSPKVYRLTHGQVNYPLTASGALTLFLNSAVDQFALNLLFEPYGLNRADGQSYFFIGNGDPCGRRTNGGCDEDNYVFRHNLPIQNFLGQWRAPMDQAQPRWYLENINDFILSVPSGNITLADGSTYQCMVRFPTKVAITIEPIADELTGDLTQIRGTAIGYLLEEDVRNIRLEFLGTTIDFYMAFFEGQEVPEDLNGDGIAAEYRFEIEFTAAAVNFVDDRATDNLSNRDPLPLSDQPAECLR